MFETIFAGLSGGLTGLLGGVISSSLDFFKQKEQNKLELKMAEIDLKSQEMEFEHQANIESIIADKERDVADAALLSASYKNDSANYSKGNDSIMLRFVDVIRGLVRPGLTIYLLYMCATILTALTETTGGISSLPNDSQLVLYSTIIDSILFMANMSVSWWFGSRSKFKQL